MFVCNVLEKAAAAAGPREGAGLRGIFILCLLAAVGGLQAAAQEDITAYERSVVMITAVNQDYDYASPWKKTPMNRGVGSGFVIEGNRILTNAHNVANQRFIEVKKQHQAQRYPARVLFAGHDCDLALLTVADPNFFDDMVPLEIGTLPRVNSTIHTYGFPIGGRQISITEGVVSRVETSTYSHSQSSRRLVIQTDAAINPGNSGGPVLQGGKVVGVAFQGLQQADNIGFMIPTTVIRHFLEDVEDGTYDGFGSLGVSLFPGLHNPSYREYLRVPARQEGVVVMNILPHSTARGILEKGDVLVRIDGFDIENDGRVFIDGFSLELSEVVDRKQIGESVDVVLYRNGERLEKQVAIAVNEPILPWRHTYDTEPDYRVFGGITFVQVNRNFLESWGRNWLTDLPFALRYLFMESSQLNDCPDRKEYVVLSEILPDEVNAYLSGFRNQVVQSVNGFEIKSLRDLDAAFAHAPDGFWVVRFFYNDSPMVIDAEKARSRHQLILNQYDVPFEFKFEDVYEM